MYFTPHRLLLIAVVITLIAVDGIYRAWVQHSNDEIGPRLFVFYTGTLTLGSALTWVGFLVKWMDA